MLKKIAKVITKHPKVNVFLAMVLIVLSVFGFLGTKVNYDVLSYLPKELDATKGTELLEEPFKMAATTMMVVDDMPEGYTDNLVKSIEKVDGVSSVLWLSDIVGTQLPKDMIPEAASGIFFSDTGTMLLIQYEKPGASEETMRAIDEIRSLCNEKCFMAGLSVMIKDTRDIINEQMPLFVGLAVILAIAAMMLALDSYVLPVILMLNIGVAVIYNFGSNIFLGQISFVTQAIAAVLQLGVTMDYSIFLFDRYNEECKNTEDKKEAMANAVVASFKALAGSSLTTVAGFLALCFMKFTLGLDVGIVMAKGVIIGIITVLTFLPALLLLCDGMIVKTKHRALLVGFMSLNEGIVKHRWLILILCALLVVPAYYAEENVDIYYKMDETLPEDLPSKVGSKILSEDFGMASSHYIVLKDDIDEKAMKEMEDSLNELPGITDILSYHALLGNKIPEFFIPKSAKKMLMQGGYQLMMVNSSFDIATDEMETQLLDMERIIKKADPDAYITGEPAMTKGLIDTTNVDFKVTNYLSIAAIFLIIAISFKSITIPIVLVMTIELAIFINQGISYFTGARVAFIAPVLINAIQLGATVDYAILMTSRFQEELKKGYNRADALAIAGITSDASIITSALVLFCATIGVSLICTLDIVGDICIMIARGAIVSAVICIFLLPSLLYIFEPLFRVTTIHWDNDGKRKKKEQDSDSL